jgi:Domain of unknown function (DUF4136)
MKLMHVAAIGLVALSATACANTMRVKTDYDKAAVFGNYHTFSVMKGNSSGNPLMDQRVAADVTQALTAKGLTEAPAGADATVVYHVATKTKHSYSTFYDGFGGGYRRWGWRGMGLGSATTFVEDYKVGTVVIDIFDAKTKQAIWHGMAVGALNDSARANAKETETAITQMFQTFPPTAAASATQ